MDNGNVVYMQMEYYLTLKKKEILAFVTTWLDWEGIILSEASQTKETNTTWSHLHVDSEENKTNKTQKQAHK